MTKTIFKAFLGFEKPAKACFDAPKTIRHRVSIFLLLLNKPSFLHLLLHYLYHLHLLSHIYSLHEVEFRNEYEDREAIQTPELLYQKMC